MPADQLRLRPPRDDERSLVVVMMLALYRDDPGSRRMTRRKAGRTVALFAAGVRGRALLIERRREVIGYLLAVPFWSNELGGTVCTIDEIYVVDHARGQGVASRVMRGLPRAMALRAFQPMVAMELEVTPRNRRARALYQRLGFRPRVNATLRKAL